MHTHGLPIVIPLSRPWPLRLWGALHAWAESRRRRQAEGSLCGLPEAALADIGAPEDWRAAAEQCRARDAMERSMLRVGIVAGAPW